MTQFGGKYKRQSVRTPVSQQKQSGSVFSGVDKRLNSIGTAVGEYGMKAAKYAVTNPFKVARTLMQTQDPISALSNIHQQIKNSGIGEENTGAKIEHHSDQSAGTIGQSAQQNFVAPLAGNYQSNDTFSYSGGVNVASDNDLQEMSNQSIRNILTKLYQTSSLGNSLLSKMANDTDLLVRITTIIKAQQAAEYANSLRKVQSTAKTGSPETAKKEKEGHAGHGAEQGHGLVGDLVDIAEKGLAGMELWDLLKGEGSAKDGLGKVLKKGGGVAKAAGSFAGKLGRGVVGGVGGLIAGTALNAATGATGAEAGANDIATTAMMFGPAGMVAGAGAIALKEGGKAALNVAYGEAGVSVISKFRQEKIVDFLNWDYWNPFASKVSVIDWKKLAEQSVEDLKALCESGALKPDEHLKVSTIIKAKLNNKLSKVNMSDIDQQVELEEKQKKEMDDKIKKERSTSPLKSGDEDSQSKPKSLWENFKNIFEPKSMAGPESRREKQAQKARRMPKEPSPADQTLGSSTKQYESGDRGSEAIGYDKMGGTSYGSYQIASKTGTMNEFIKHLEESGKGDVAAELKSAGPSDTGGKSGAFVEKWQELVKSGKLTEEDQHNFIQKTHYDPAASKAKELGFKLEDKGMQDAVWSGSVQHGGINKILERTAKETKNFENLSAEEQIKAYYKVRGQYAKENGVDQEERYTKEQQSVLAKSAYAKEHPETQLAKIPEESKPLEQALAEPTKVGETPQQNPVNTPTVVKTESAQASQQQEPPAKIGGGIMKVRNDDPLLLTLQYGNLRTT